MRGLALLMTLHFGDGPNNSDRWFAEDKAKHFLMSMFVQSGAFSAFRTTGMSRHDSLIGATIVTAGVGIGKELYDRKYGGDPSFRDLAADGAGIVAASLLLAQTPK
jgi:uncharacterized protein YfiM (DUF2279 family)